MAELDRIHHAVFIHLVGAGFNHHDAFGGADDHDVDLAFALLVVGGVDDEFIVDQADAHRADRTGKRNIGEGKCNRRAVDSGNIRIVLGISRKHEGDDLGLGAEAFREQRTDGTINLTAGQNLALAHPSFALDEAAGNAASGVGVFAIVNGKRKEIDADAGLGVGAGGCENNGFANANNRGAVSLFGPVTGLK